jgi:glycosyltransferase involved in cell wall biosynthesis
MTQAPGSDGGEPEAPGAATWRDCLSSVSFWSPDRLGPQTAWLEHAPFAFWLVETLRPSTLVELGTHGGFSYFAFCQVIQRLGVGTRCWAVDTWRGDEHAGFYGDEVFEQVRQHHDPRYSAFSTLVRSTFDDALHQFPDGSVDLLHVDGRHYYEDVKHDLEVWRAKLSDRAVVLMHDTNVRDRDFGVYRLWSELRAQGRHFEFVHGNGLGVLGVGDRLPAALDALFRASGRQETAAQIRDVYSRLGSAVSLQFTTQQQRTELQQWKVETDALRRDIAARIDIADALQRDVALRDDEAEALRKEIALRADEAEVLRGEIERRREETEGVRREVAVRLGEIAAVRREVLARTDELEAARREGGARADELEAMRREAAAWNDALEAARREITLRVAEAEALRGDVAARIEEREGLRRAAVARAAEAEALRREVSARTDEASVVRGELTTRDTAIEGLRHQVASRGAEARGLRDDLARRAAEAAALRDEIAILDARTSALERALDATGRRMTEVQSVLHANRANAARTDAELGRAHRRITELGVSLSTQQREAHVMRTSTSWLITRPIREVRARYPRVADFGRRALRSLVDGDQVAPHEQLELPPGEAVEVAFLEPYYRSAGLSGEPAAIYEELRRDGWPAYPTYAAAEGVAGVLRASGLFDARAYAARLDDATLDPALHYVVVGERMGWMPSDQFDPSYYAERHADVARAGTNLLAHYVLWGRGEGRRALSAAARLRFDQSRIDPARETILLITHQASRTGAPIVAYNIAQRLRLKYNIVAVVLSGGELVPHFEALCAAVVGPLTYPDWNSIEAEHLVRHLTRAYRVHAAIANSIESRFVLPALAHHLVPVVTLAHEFASYTRPSGAMGQALDWSTQVIFSAELVARNAQQEHPTLAGRTIHVLRQGRCDVPARWDGPEAGAKQAPDLARVFRPRGAEDALVVLGCGTVHIRKGVDLFLACAAAVTAAGTKRPVRFIWIGHGYDPENDVNYSCYLADQIARSGLQGHVEILDEVEDLEPAYRLADVFFLSSRLDPLPNVTIEAALRGMPVVCFEEATGIGEVLDADPRTRRCVVPHMDAAAAARIIAEFADHEDSLKEAGAVTRSLAEAAFDMDRYVSRIDDLIGDAARIGRQRTQDFETIRENALFDQETYIPPFYPGRPTRDQAIVGYLARWTAVGLSRRPATNGLFRRPCVGFHPQIYAHAQSPVHDPAAPNPFADFIRRGRPAGPWRAELLGPMPTPDTSGSPALRIGLHAHFYYPDLAEDLLRKFATNRRPCDLLLTTDTDAKARTLREATASYKQGEVTIRIVPNRGRDLGPLFTELGETIGRYDVIGHVHGKRSLIVDDAWVGEPWREFLWQHLLGDRHPMLDVIAHRFAVDERVGLVFPADPHLSDWDANLPMATELAARMGLAEALPPFFDFPLGTMFWARPAALRPMLDLRLGWDDYPHEPVPIDGTILHALERLLPFAARKAGYGYVTTHVPGVTW